MDEPNGKHKYTVELHGELAEMGSARPRYLLKDVKRTLKLCRQLLKLMARNGNLSLKELETRLKHLSMFRENIEVAYKEGLEGD